VLTNIR